MSNDEHEALRAKLEDMWDALEYVDAHIDLEEEINEEVLYLYLRIV